MLNADPDNLTYHHGLVVSAFDTSQISARIDNNAFINNYELGLFIRTFGQGTINASINDNAFANDIGEDTNNTFNADGFGGVNYLGDTLLGPDGDGILDSNIRDFAAQNNDFGNQCLALSSNVFKLLATFRQESLQPGSFQLELEGASNGFDENDGDLFGGLGSAIATGRTGVCESLISNEELFFIQQGLFSVDANTPSGAAFQALDHD